MNAPDDVLELARPRRHYTELVQRYGVVIAWMALILVFSLASPAFRQLSTVQIVLGTQSTILLITLAAVTALRAGEFDMSAANVLAMSAAGIAWLNVNVGLNVWLSVAIVVLTALTVGVINAVIVVTVGVSSIVVTLGMGTLIAGLTLGVAGSQVRGGIDPAFTGFITHRMLGLPVAFYIAIAIAAILYYVFEHTPLGRGLYFVGRSSQVSALSGLPVSRLRATSLIMSSGLASLAGVILAGYTGAGDPNVASSYMLPAFAAAFLGSTAVRPGEFNIGGALVAVFFLITGVTGLQLLGQTGWVSQAFYGGSLVVAVVLTQIVARRRMKRRRITPESTHNDKSEES